MYVCLYVCMYVRTYIGMYVRTYDIRTYVRTYVRMYVRTSCGEYSLFFSECDQILSIQHIKYYSILNYQLFTTVKKN